MGTVLPLPQVVNKPSGGPKVSPECLRPGCSAGKLPGNVSLYSTALWRPPVPDGTRCPGTSFSSASLLFHSPLTLPSMSPAPFRVELGSDHATRFLLPSAISPARLHSALQAKVVSVFSFSGMSQVHLECLRVNEHMNKGVGVRMCVCGLSM